MPSPEQSAFYQRIDPYNLYPLWEAIDELQSATPVTDATPHVWRFDDIRPRLLEAADLIGAEAADRRTLMLENPSMRGRRRITEALYAGLQCIMPGEVAMPHRHTPSAMRMVIESDGAHSEVDGEPVDMRPGDLILNQSWHWHGHANEGAGPHISMTCLDMPLTRFLGPLFAESLGASSVPGGRPEGDGLARYGANMRRMGSAAEAVVSPIARYPYDRTREALAGMARSGELDPCHGIKMEFINPVTGGPVLPTLSAFMQLLPAGFTGAWYRSTAAWVYHVVEGEGRTVVGDETIAWGRRDIFVVPAWYPHRHEPAPESVLYSFSDRGVQQKLGVYRELRGAAAEG